MDRIPRSLKCRPLSEAFQCTDEDLSNPIAVGKLPALARPFFQAKFNSFPDVPQGFIPSFTLTETTWNHEAIGE